MAILIACIAIFLVALLLAFLMKGIMGSQTTDKVMAKHESSEDKNNVFVKKYPEVNLDKWRTTFGLIGLASTLGLILLSIELYAERDRAVVEQVQQERFETVDVFVDEEEIPEELPPPPPRRA